MLLAWILTTKCKSLKRVETCQKDHFTFWLFVMLTRSSVLIFQTVFTLWIYIYIHVIFSTLNPWLFIRIWMMLFLSRIWKKPRLCLVDYTHTPYSFCLLKCAIIPLDPHWPVMIMIISSCLVPIVIQSAIWDVYLVIIAVTGKRH